MKHKKQRNSKSIIGICAIICIFGLVAAILYITDSGDSNNTEIASSQQSSMAVEAVISLNTDNNSQQASSVSSKSTASVVESEAEPVYVPVEKLKLNKYSVTVMVGKKDMPLVTMYPKNSTNKREKWYSSDEKIATVDKYGNILGVAEGKCVVTVRSVDNKKAFAKVKVTVTPYVAPVKVKATYIKGILIANKSYALPYDYNPGVNSTAYSSLQKMFTAAKKDGLKMHVSSGFRSYNTQKQLYNNYVARDGKTAADRYSARPGHSEHQTGLAFDINSASPSFAATPQAKWLSENCHKYGFIIRYPKGKESITGYMYEPWHIRYLGVETATAVYESGLALEEYLGITSVYSY